MTVLLYSTQVNVRIAELRRELIPRLEAALLAPAADDRHKKLESPIIITKQYEANTVYIIDF